jgi:hypothetical protein
VKNEKSFIRLTPGDVKRRVELAGTQVENAVGRTDDVGVGFTGGVVGFFV